MMSSKIINIFQLSKMTLKSGTKTLPKVVNIQFSLAFSSDAQKVAKQFPIVEYDEIKNLPKTPEKRLIDVREPKELQETGVIPTSCNVPLGELAAALKLQPDAFKSKYGCMKPAKDQYIIFSCKAGVRAVTAAEIADGQSYTGSHVYKGSWIDWAKHENLPY